VVARGGPIRKAHNVAESDNPFATFILAVLLYLLAVAVDLDASTLLLNALPEAVMRNHLGRCLAFFDRRQLLAGGVHGSSRMDTGTTKQGD
jgi:hypothetical protein